MSARTTVFVISLFAGAALARDAIAQPSVEERAGALVDEGNRHYNVAEYPEAIKAYKEAYKLIPEPLLLWNLAQAYRLDNDCTNALKFYKNYVREAPSGQFRAMADQRIPEMEACAKKASPPPTSGTNETNETTTTDPRLQDPLGDGRGPGSETGPIGPSAGGSGGEPTDTKPGGSLRIAGFALTGAGVLGIAAGGYFSLKARGIASDAERDCADDCAGSVLNDYNERGEAADKNAMIGYIAGGVFLAAGVTTIFIARSRDEKRATVTLVPTPGGATASAAWSF
jgi:tetratricopeptide (TPR) repeat protein